VVYRPLGITKRKLIQRKRAYRNHGTNYFIRKKRYRLNRKIDNFDNINYRIFFDENNWDYDEKRNLHRAVRIGKLGRFMKRKWLPDTDTQPKGMFERKKKKFVMYLADLLIKLLIDDMIETGNKITFAATKTNNRTLEGYFKIGVFKDKGIFTNFENLILSIVPGTIERISDYYPLVILENELKRKLKNAYILKKREYESIDIQERIAAHNRLSGLYRRVVKSPKN